MCISVKFDLPWREAVKLVEEEDAGFGGPGAVEGLPHGLLRLADVLREQLRSL